MNVYTMRTRTLKLSIGEQTVKANVFKFARKESLAWSKFEAYLQELQKERAQQAVENCTGFAVLVVDEIHGSPVYSDVTKGMWTDDTPFPGKLIGYVHRNGYTNTVRNYSPWQYGWIVNGAPHRRRCVLATDGEKEEVVSVR